MPKITTIGGGNGQSTLLAALNNYLKGEYEISTIVSMSDDGRTTGELIRNFNSKFGIHLPPLGDLRKCFYCSSKSKYVGYFKNVLENIFSCDLNISDLSIRDLFRISTDELFENLGKVIQSEYSDCPIIVDSNLPESIIEDVSLFKDKQIGELADYIEKYLGDFLDIKLPLDKSIRGHKFGNIMMASIFYHLGDFNKILEIMHDLIKVMGKIIPVTIEKAFIKANLENGEVVETQDNISNDAEYTSKIVSIELMENSKSAKHTTEVDKAIIDADYIIVAPGDLFTSTISNFIIGGVKDSIKKSSAKIIFIGNNTNKGGETVGFRVIDFVEHIEKYLGKPIDYFISNDKKIILSGVELEKFKTNVSVQGGDFLYLEEEEKKLIEKKGIKVITADLIDREIYYKHDKKKIAEIIYNLTINEKGIK